MKEARIVDTFMVNAIILNERKRFLMTEGAIKIQAVLLKTSNNVAYFLARFTLPIGHVMDLFEKVALFEKMATELADEVSVPEVSSPSNNESILAEDLATTAKARREVIKVRASLFKQLAKR